MSTISIITRRNITLIEIMIVMALIALIGGALAYNFQGSFEQGKIFSTKEKIERIRNILVIKMAEDPSAVEDIESKWEDIVTKSPLISDPKSAVVDGWGEKFRVALEENADGATVLTIHSRRLDEMEHKTK